MSKLKTGVIITSVLIILGIIGLILQNPYLVIERESDNIVVPIEYLDSLVNDEIIKCESGGRFCYKTMPGWLEICKNEPTYKDVPSCHDGRIEQLIKNPPVISEECMELHEIMKNLRSIRSPEQIPHEQWRQVMSDMDRLGCP